MDMIKIKIGDKEYEKEEGVLLNDLAKELQGEYDRQIALAVVNGKLRELTRKLHKDSEVEFVTTEDKKGFSAYKRTIAFVLQKAVYDLYGKDGVSINMLQSTGVGQFCRLEGKDATDAVITEIKEEMQKIIDADEAIQKISVATDKAIKIFEKFGMTDKATLFKYRRSSAVNLYCLGEYRDYSYGYMMPSTGCVKDYAIEPYRDGFVLIYPLRATGEIKEFMPSDRLFEVQSNSAAWGASLGIKNVGQLNDAVTDGRIQDIILLQEAEMEARIGALAQTIANCGKDIKFVMIAGPSSSGKTSFSHRLSLQLRSCGLTPHPIAMDDFYVNRVDTPRDEKGEYDYECLEAIDVELFNKNMMSLLNGERVELPTYNFVTGVREYGKGRFLQMGKDDILVLEGIHGLNDKLSYMLPAESKFKIYISALTQLAIDEHDALPTTDGRLIRRIVRDARTRGTTAADNIKRWDSVRRGEEKYIFPFQEKADYIFNSALIYELAVLKVYAEPLLFSVKKDCPEYFEAKRLLKFLDYFLPVPSENIHHNSLIREFIGGSCFKV